MTTCWETLKKEFLKNPCTGRRIDVLIFGATGCAGRYTVIEAVHVLRYCSWGVAGRNKTKLKSLLEEVGMQTRRNLSRIPIIVANIKERWSLVRMTRRCKVLVNCCGPYETLGEPVIKACLFTRTHYVDLCIESHFMDLMQYRYELEARRKRVYIVSACGLQSLPMEIGVNYMTKHFHGTINHIEAYVEFWTDSPFGLEGLGNTNNWTSFVLGNINRKKLRRRTMPKIKPPAPCRPILFQTDIIEGFCVPSPTVDEDIADRTQLYFYDEKQRRPIKLSSYFVFPHLFIAAALLIWYFLIALLSQFGWTRKLLLKWPRIFSFGIVSPCQRSEQSREDTMFRITFQAVGWEQSTNNEDLQYGEFEEPCKTLTAKVTGQCPLYGVACVCLLVSATTILKERIRLPHGGGVFTPGVAFAKTNIVAELQKYEHGLSFQKIQTLRTKTSSHYQVGWTSEAEKEVK